MLLPDGNVEVFSSEEIQFIWLYRDLLFGSDRLSVWADLQKTWSYRQYGDGTLVPAEFPDGEKNFLSLDAALFVQAFRDSGCDPDAWTSYVLASLAENHL